MLERERKRVGLHAPRRVEVDQHQVRGRADRDAGPVEPEDRAPGRRTSARAASRATAGPARRARCRATANAVSSPVTPNGAASNGTSFSSRRVRRVIGRDRLDRAVLQRLDERGAVLGASQRRVHLQVRVERAHCLVGEAEVMRRRPRRSRGPRPRGRAAGGSTDSRAERCIRWSGWPVSPARSMSRATIRLSPSDGQPPRPSSAETAPMCMCPPGSAIGSSQWTASSRPVIALYSSARRITPARRDGPAVVGEGRRAGVGELAHLGRAREPSCPFVMRGHEADRHLGLLLGPGPQAAEGVGVVDHRIGVRDRQDRAVPARRGGGGARGDRLLVLAARACGDGRAGRRTPAPGSSPCAVDDAVLVRVEPARRSGRSRRRRSARRGSRRPPRPGRARARRGRRCSRVPVRPASITPPPPRTRRRPARW